MIIYVGNKKTYLALHTVKVLIRNNNLLLCKYIIIHNVARRWWRYCTCACVVECHKHKTQFSLQKSVNGNTMTSQRWTQAKLSVCNVHNIHHTYNNNSSARDKTLSGSN